MPLHLQTYMSQDEFADVVKKYIIEEIESFSSIELKPFYIENISNDTNVGLITLCGIDKTVEYNNLYNSTVEKIQVKISKKNRFTIPGNGDMFHKIYIPCICPEQEIESISLYIAIVFPKDKKLPIGSNEYIYDRSKVDYKYYLLKTINNITNNYITFFDKPISTRYVTYSVEIKYKEPMNESYKFIHNFNLPAVIEYYYLRSDLRSIINYNYLKINEHNYCPLNKYIYENNIFII